MDKKNKKIAVIIGVTGGIGSAVMQRLSEQNIKVYGTYYKGEENAKKIKDRIKNSELIKCDITSAAEIDELIQRVEKNEGKIDFLINTATPPLKLKRFEELSVEEIDQDIKTILLGGMYLVKKSIPLMKNAGGGVIINLITAAIIDIPPRMTTYIAAKTGLLGFSKAAVNELKTYNIKIVNISPSFVETELIKAFPAKLIEIEREKQPDKKLLQPEEIAEVISKIINNPERYDSGTNIIIKTKQDLLNATE